MRELQEHSERKYGIIVGGMVYFVARNLGYSWAVPSAGQRANGPPSGQVSPSHLLPPVCLSVSNRNFVGGHRTIVSQGKLSRLQ